MIGFTSVSLRKYTVEEVVDAAVKAKADFIEWGSDVHVKTPDDAKKAKKLCDENGIAIRAYGTYYRIGCHDRAAWTNICECASIMGAKYVRTWLGTKGSKLTSQKEYEKLLDDARLCCDEAAKYGLTVSNECHHDTYNDETDSSLKFLADIGRDNMKTYYQSWYRDEAGDKDKLYKLISYVTDTHISFSEMDKFQLLHKKDKEYIIKILSWLRDLSFEGGLTIEFTKNDKADNLIGDVERLRELWSRA